MDELVDMQHAALIADIERRLMKIRHPGRDKQTLPMPLPIADAACYQFLIKECIFPPGWVHIQREALTFGSVCYTVEDQDQGHLGQLSLRALLGDQTEFFSEVGDWPANRMPTLFEVKRMVLAMDLFNYCLQGIRKDFLQEAHPERKLTDVKLPHGLLVDEAYQPEYPTTLPECYMTFQLTNMLVILFRELPETVILQHYERLIDANPITIQPSLDKSPLEKPRRRGGRPPYQEDGWLREQVYGHGRNPNDPKLRREWRERWSHFRHAEDEERAYKNALKQRNKLQK